MSTDPVEEAMIAGLTARGYTVTAPDGETHVAKIVEKPVDRWHSRGVEIKTLRGDCRLSAQWRGRSDDDAVKEREWARQKVAEAMARQLLEDGFIEFRDERDPNTTGVTLLGELTIGVPASLSTATSRPPVTGRLAHVIPDWAIEASKAGVFGPKVESAISRMTGANYAEIEKRALAALSTGANVSLPGLTRDDKRGG